MPRPPDNYTHAQFELIDSENQGETVRCVHCRNWTGSIKTLNRKKEHLLKCPTYAAWRAAGNGQNLAPPNKYHRRDTTSLNPFDGEDGEESQSNPLANTYRSPYDYTGKPATQSGSKHRESNIDVNKYFDEFFDDGVKCMRVRCQACGFVRAKSRGRQIEHLSSCQDFLSSSEGQAAVQRGDIDLHYQDSAILNGTQPNPNLLAARPLQKSQSANNLKRPLPGRVMPKPQPSLANHLSKAPEGRIAATQSDFLKHAGCGTLSSSALSHWLNQHGYISRAMVSFIGTLIGKVKLPVAKTLRQNGQYRTLDLLISTVSNVRKELDFIEASKTKYQLRETSAPPTPIINAYVDLLASCAAPNTSLLQGMVALWATEFYYNLAWQYAGSFASTMPAPSNYSIPSYLTPSQNTMPGYPNMLSESHSSDIHILALQEALIPNWTSPQFSKFVDACRAIVDELANAQTSGHGMDELNKCQQVFDQITWLWLRMWPDVTGMGELTEVAEQRAAAEAQENQNANAGSARKDGRESKQNAIDVDDDEDAAAEDDADASMDAVESPYGGTGLGAIAAANQHV